MFTLEVEQGLKLVLIEQKFASQYFEIVNREREYLSQWLAWPPHANNEDFFLSFIRRSRMIIRMESHSFVLCSTKIN